MRKGKLALVMYIIGTLFAGGGALYCYLTATNNTEGGLENLGYAILMVYGLILFAFYAALLLIKVFYLISGWKIFPFLCMLADLGLVGLVVYALSGSLIETDTVLGNVALLAALIIAPLIAFFSEIKALKD